VQYAKDKDVRYLRGAPPSGWRSRRSIVVIGLIIGSLFLLVPLIGDNGLTSYFQLHEERERIQQEVDDLEATRKEIQASIDALENSPDALEKVARERYNMRRPDEEVMVIMSQETKKTSPP